ncbi:MAG: methyltransferase domain-containing protein [Pseudomonadota bacterium]
MSKYEQAGPGPDLSQTYFATGREVDHERARLERLAAEYDPWTQDWLSDVVSVQPGHRVIEAGPGAGSMLDWLAAEVGEGGEVLGLDLELRHTAAPVDPIRHRQGDVAAEPTEPGRFDLAYARLLFEHLDAPEAALAQFAAWLKPGGRLAVIALDCSVTRAEPGQGETGASFDRAVEVVTDALAASGLVDPVFGVKLPDVLAGLGLDAVKTRRFDRVLEGGSDWAVFLAENNLAIAAQLGVTGPAQIVADAMRRPGFRFRDQALVGVSAVRL